MFDWGGQSGWKEPVWRIAMLTGRVYVLAAGNQTRNPGKSNKGLRRSE